MHGLRRLAIGSPSRLFRSCCFRLAFFRIFRELQHLIHALSKLRHSGFVGWVLHCRHQQLRRSGGVLEPLEPSTLRHGLLRLLRPL
eukprot:COSAG03_NODE_8030_length_844_cov_0.966443_1_plen_85_part_10